MCYGKVRLISTFILQLSWYLWIQVIHSHSNVMIKQINPFASDSEKHLRVYTLSHDCHSHEWRVDMATGKTLKKRNAYSDVHRSAVEKKIAGLNGLRSKGVIMLSFFYTCFGKCVWPLTKYSTLNHVSDKCMFNIRRHAVAIPCDSHSNPREVQYLYSVFIGCVCVKVPDFLELKHLPLTWVCAPDVFQRLHAQGLFHGDNLPSWNIKVRVQHPQWTTWLVSMLLYAWFVLMIWSFV